VGDEAVLFGDPTLGAPPVEAWADAAGTINYEIVTRIGPRVPRREGRREVTAARCAPLAGIRDPSAALQRRREDETVIAAERIG
jgi:hypothetical protein